MEDDSKRRPRTTLKQEFNLIGTFTQQADGTIVPELTKTSKEEGLVDTGDTPIRG